MHKRRAAAALIAVAVGTLSAPVSAQPPTLQIPHVSTPPRLDDYLDGHERREEARVSGFRQNRPGDGDPASQETTAYLSYDERNVYVVFVCKDREPEKVRARLTKRDAVFGDDFVAVALDTFHDRRRAYLFIANPLGIQTEGIMAEAGPEDYSFDTLWHTNGRLTRDGYVVWMAIPFKSLRFQDTPSQTWGFALARIIPRANEQSIWPYITTRLQGFIQQLATLTGLERISPGRNAQLIPYGTFATARLLDRTSGRHLFEDDARVGLDAKMVFRDAFTFDLGLNPDFSQVESDEPQVTVNERFEVFFPEKRPFFIENVGFFQTPIDLFFSRRIVNPQFGGRLTAKIAGWTLGALAIDDRAPGRRLTASEPAFGVRAGSGVVRVQREFAQQSGIGLLVTSRDFSSSANRVFAADLRLKLNPNWVFTGQAAASDTHELDGRDRSGPAYLAKLERGGRNFEYRLTYLDRSPDFRAQLGFIPRVDIRQADQFVGYRWRPAQRRLLSFGPRLFTSINWDRQGRRQDWIIEPSWALEWTGQTTFDVSRREAFELFDDIEFRKQSTRVFFRTEWLKWLALSGSYNRGTNINFVPARGLDPSLGASTTARASVTLRPTPPLNYDQTYIYTRLTTRPGSLVPGIRGGAPIFSNHIVRSRVNYQFTRELSLRAIFDYNGVERDQSLVSLDRRKRFTADVLFTYLVNPWTAIYVGYTDNYENLLIHAEEVLSRTSSPVTSTGRQFFVKTNYLLRF